MSELRSYQRKVCRLISTEVERTSLRPVSINEAKSYARVDNDFEDDTIDMLIESARNEFENYTGKLMFKREVKAVFECEGYSLLILPFAPAVEVISVTNDGEDVEYEFKGDRINTNSIGEVEVVYECGLFDSQADNDARLGVLKFITSNFEDRQDIAAMGIAEMPNSSKKHWLKYKRFSL